MLSRQKTIRLKLKHTNARFANTENVGNLGKLHCLLGSNFTFQDQMAKNIHRNQIDWNVCTIRWLAFTTKIENTSHTNS